MKVTATLSTLAMVGAVIAQDYLLPKRDVTVITKAISDSSAAMQALDASVKAFDGQTASKDKVLADADKLQAVLKSSAEAIKPVQPISATEAVGLQNTLSPVQQIAQSLVTDLTAKKDEVQKSGSCAKVAEKVKAIGAEAKNLIQVVISKTPQNIQQLAGQATSQFTGQLEGLVSTFSGQSCVDSASGGAGPAPAPAAGPAASSSISTGVTGVTLAQGNNSGGSSGMPGMPGGGGKSAAPVTMAGTFGLLVATAASLMML